MFGKMLRFMRIHKHIQQGELAKKINVTDTTIARYELEHRAVTLETANDIANACGFEILFLDKSDNKTYRFVDVQRLDYDKRVIKK